MTIHAGDAGADLAPVLEAPCPGCADPARCRFVVDGSHLRLLGGEPRQAERYRCANPRPPETPATGEESSR